MATLYNWAPYQAASKCVGREMPGTLALDAFIEEQFPSTWFGNIYSCRDIVGGSGYSHHAEGRADDRMVPQTRPPSGISVGLQIVRVLGPHGRALGIDHIICNAAPWEPGRGKPLIFSATAPQGRVYTGEHPHDDHDHIGLTRTAALSLTLATIRKTVLGNTGGIDMANPVTIAGFQFYDVAKWPSWAAKSIREAIESGVIHGKEFTEDPKDRIFAPDDPVSRAELAVVLNRAKII